ncbi:helix-turn-helix domain-containing protein [Fredinandcohnia humi]
MKKVELNTKALRERKGLSQAELGKRIGKSQQQVYVIENGGTVKLDVLAKLMEVLDCDISDLFVVYEQIK